MVLALANAINITLSMLLPITYRVLLAEDPPRLLWSSCGGSQMPPDNYVDGNVLSTIL